MVEKLAKKQNTNTNCNLNLTNKCIWLSQDLNIPLTFLNFPLTGNFQLSGTLAYLSSIRFSTIQCVLVEC